MLKSTNTTVTFNTIECAAVIESLSLLFKHGKSKDTPLYLSIIQKMLVEIEKQDAGLYEFFNKYLEEFRNVANKPNN